MHRQVLKMAWSPKFVKMIFIVTGVKYKLRNVRVLEGFVNNNLLKISEVTRQKMQRQKG